MRLAIILCAFIVIAVSAPTEGDVPQTISYQGVLKQPDGNVVPDDEYSLTFALYNVASGGSPLWEETQTVAVAGGIFSVVLGSVTPLDVPFDEPYWLGIAVGADPELAPRIELSSSPYALRAAAADSIVGVGTGIGGSGQTNRIPRFTAATTLGNSAMLQTTGGRIAIGTDAPDAKLSVETSAPDAGEATAGSFRSSVGLDGIAHGIDVEAYKSTWGSARAVYGLARGSGDGYGDATGVYGEGDIGAGEYGTAYGLHGVARAGDNGTAYGVYGQANVGRNGVGWGGYFNGDLYASGRVGIGATVPEQKLDVRGDVYVVGNVGINSVSPDATLDVRDYYASSFLANAVGYFGTETPNTIALLGDATLAMSPSLPELSIAVCGVGGDYSGYFLGHAYVGGNLGIAKLNPEERLDVNGAVRMTGLKMPSGATEGYVLTCQDATSGEAAWTVPPTSGVGGSGTAGKIAKFTDATTLASSVIEESSSNVGIGTSPGTHRLTVSGNVQATAFYGDGSNLTGVVGADDDWTISGNNVYRGTSTGNVGIGTSNPTSRLEVVGNIELRDENWIGIASNAERLTFDSDGNDIELLGANVGVGVTDPTSRLVVDGDIEVRDDDWIGIGSTTERILFDADGDDIELLGANVGVGIFDPAYRLTVNGQAGFNEKLIHNGDSDTYIKLDTNGIRLFAAGYDLLDASGWDTQKYVVVNIGQQDVDFKVQSVNTMHAMIVRGDNGNVGIGTGSPNEKLDVFGTTQTQVLKITGGTDVAEPFAVSGGGELSPGSVVVIDDENPGSLRLSDEAYDKRVAGVISGAGGVSPGLTLSQKGFAEEGQHVALAGRVYCWADASYGAIEPGDRLTTSETPGHAMRAADSDRADGAVIGKAMTPLSEGRDLVLVLVQPQ